MSVSKDKNYVEVLAKHALRIGAIKLNPDQPFQWASGYFMPIYNDNRMFLGDVNAREHVINGISEQIDFRYEGSTLLGFIAGTSTAGIPWGAIVADRMDKPFIYVRDKPKEHGLRNQIEGIDSEKDLEGKHGVLIEDLISTGGSSAKAVQAIRKANGLVYACISIFNYGFREAREMFEGTRTFDGVSKLDSSCTAVSLLGYNALVDVAQKIGYITRDQADMLAGWRTDPFGWGTKNGHPPIDPKDKK